MKAIVKGIRMDALLGLDVVSLASTLASDLAHLVESMNLADRPTSNSNRTTRYPDTR